MTLRGMEPPMDPELTTFWDGTREQQLLLPHCSDCGTVFWYPRATCPSCLSEAIDWKPSAGTGSVHAVSVMARGDDPYAVVLVDLDDGVRLMSNTTTPDVQVGARVRLTWEALSDGRHLWLFEPGG